MLPVKHKFYSTYIEIYVEPNDTVTQRQLETNILCIHHNRKRTIYTTSMLNIVDVLALTRDIHTEDDIKVDSVRQLYIHIKNKLKTTEDIKTQKGFEPLVVNEYLTLSPHQHRGLKLAQLRDKYCFYFDTRVGKTPLSLTIINNDIKLNPKHKWLVVCPLVLIENAWLEDAEKFFPDMKVVNCWAKTKDKRIKQMQQDSNVYIVNVESFDKYSEYFDNMDIYGIIVDESSVMKAYNAKRSIALVNFINKTKRGYLLSGSPAPNNESEYYMQLKAIDYYLVSSAFTPFTSTFFTDISRSPQYKVLQLRPDMKQLLSDLIAKVAIYVDKQDVLTLPGREFYEEIIHMPEELEEAYKQMKSESAIQIQNETITAVNAANMLNKLNQVTAGFILYHDEDDEADKYKPPKVKFLSDYRFKALAEILSRYPDEQVLIWANYRYEFEKITEMLGDKCRCVNGRVSAENKSANIKAFKAGKIQYLVANPASADKGLTLTNCHICVYFSLNWSYELYKQSMDRIYADISKQPKFCKYHIILAAKSVNEAIYHNVLQGKQEASYLILNYLKGGAAL